VALFTIGEGEDGKFVDDVGLTTIKTW